MSLQCSVGSRQKEHPLPGLNQHGQATAKTAARSRIEILIPCPLALRPALHKPCSTADTHPIEVPSMNNQPTHPHR
jgi:hypothetical protein